MVSPLYNLIDSSTAAEPGSNRLYESLDLQIKGLSRPAFNAAIKGYHKLVEQKKISSRYLTICDFSQSSSKKRFYLLDMKTNLLVLQTYVAHGKNSGSEYAARFSNKPSSLQSSLGFYETLNTYHGEHGLSLRVRGLESGFNDKAHARAIVIHGADYIEEKWLNRSGTMGRSFGCPAIPRSESRKIINTIKDGSLVFVYHPSKNYLTKSRILND